MAAVEKQTLVEEGTELNGSLKSTCPIVVRGRIEGNVATPSLTVSPTGAVHGKAKVGTLASQGELSGEFDADVVQLSGTVKDKTIIRAKSLEVKLGAQNGKLQVVFGETELDVGEAPSATDAVEKPVGQEGGKKKDKGQKALANGESQPPPPPPSVREP